MSKMASLRNQPNTLICPVKTSHLNTISPSPSSSPSPHHPILPGFLCKIYEIFSNTDFIHICGWNEAGDTIIIHKPIKFTTDILPLYFKHQNFASFTRQLNLYGFHKTVLDSTRREFQHPNFKRGQYHLLYLIKRKSNTNTNTNSNTNINHHNNTNVYCLNNQPHSLPAIQNSENKNDNSMITSNAASIMHHQTSNDINMMKSHDCCMNTNNNIQTKLENNQNGVISKFEAHRQLTDSLLMEMKSLRDKNQEIEKRLNNLEYEHNLMRAENANLWEKLETSKNRQLIMQNKMKKILWVMFHIFKLDSQGNHKNGITHGNSIKKRKIAAAENNNNEDRIETNGSHQSNIFELVDDNNHMHTKVKDSNTYDDALIKAENDLNSEKKLMNDPSSLSFSPICPPADLYLPNATVNNNNNFFLPGLEKQDNISNNDYNNNNTFIDTITHTTSNDLKKEDMNNDEVIETSNITNPANSFFNIFGPVISDPFFRQQQTNLLTNHDDNTNNGNNKDSQTDVLKSDNIDYNNNEINTTNDTTCNSINSFITQPTSNDEYEKAMQKLDDIEVSIFDHFDPDSLENLLANFESQNNTKEEKSENVSTTI